MKPLGKIAGINLAVLLVYSLLIRVLASGGGNQGRAIGILMFSAIAVGIHVIICLAFASAKSGGNDKALSRAWLATSGIVLLIGFSACLGNASL